jgi:hypothetical protein
MFNWRTGTPTGLGKYMDIIILNKHKVIYNKPLHIARTIFISTRLCETLIFFFIDYILPKLKSSVNLIIAGEDYTFPNSTDKRHRRQKERLTELKNLGKHKYINKVFVENLDESLENVEPIPLGINPRECSTDIACFLKFEQINYNKPLKFTNFNRFKNNVQFEERKVVLELCKTKWTNLYIPFKNCKHEEFLKKMGSYIFTICVHGGGLDVNPKLFEALLLGVIPIIKENKPYTDIYKTLDFPVVIVKSWEEDTINEENLKLWHKKYYHYFTDKIKREEMLKKMSLNYWINYVNK